jgi:nucleotide-binding universal stress UspA family protein
VRGKNRTTLVAYDGSATAKAAVRYAARRLEPNGRLVVAHVIVPPAEYFDELYDEWRHRARERGEALLRDVKDTLGGVAAELRVAEGPPANTLVELAREAGADEIVIGSRGLGASRALLGSVSHALLHETDRPVVVLTQRATEREARRDTAGGAVDGHLQIVGYDGSSTARAALEYALRRGPVTAVYASDSALRGRDVLKQLGRDAGDRGDVEFDQLNGPPAEALLLAARARDAAAIVVGSRGLGPVRGALGSVSEALLHEADTPVIVVPGLDVPR